MGKILVKQAPAVQQFQQIGQGDAPSIAGLFGRFKDPTASRMDKVRAGLGLAGKAGALAATGLSTANSLQSGNIGGALSAYNTYRGIDPTIGTMQRDVTPAEKQRTMVTNAQNQMNTNDLSAMTNAGIDVTNTSAATPDQLNQYQSQSPFYQPAPAPAAPAPAPAAPAPAPAAPAPAPAAPAPVATPPTTAVGQSGPLNTALPNQAQTLGQIVGGQNVSGVPQPTTPPVPAPAAPAPAPAAPAPAAPAPVAQPTTPQGGLLNRINNQQLPAPERHVGVTSGTANAGNQKGLLGKVKSEEEFQEARQGLQQQRAFESELNNLNLPPAQQREVAEVVPEPQPAQEPQPTTRENRAAMDEKIRTLGQDPEIARRAEELKKPASVKPSMQTPPPPPPTIDTTPVPSMTPTELLGGGSAELTPARRQEGVVPDLTRTTEYGSKYKPTLVDNYTHTRNQLPMSGSDLLQGTGIAKPVKRGSKEFEQWAESLNYEPMQYQQQNPIDAAMRTLDRRQGNVGQTTSLGQGATITRRPAGATPTRTLSGDTSLPIQNDGMSLGDAKRNLASFQDDPDVQWYNKAFVDMVFNEFGDLFHKADPHEVGSIVMGLYLDKMVR